MASTSMSTQSATDDRHLMVLTFGGLAAAIVGSAVALTLSLGVYTPSAFAGDLAVGDNAVVSTDAVIADVCTWSSGEFADGMTGWAGGVYRAPA